jgi:hypothetical protein
MNRTWVTSLALAVVLAGALAFSAEARDWYVRAGSDGEGTKESPAGDLWRPLEKALRGDVIHVSAGTYNSKGGSGHFVVRVPGLTLAGGYSADFAERNPFKHLTILERSRDFRGDWTGLPEGIIAGKGGDHTGLVVDGFVLNGESRNAYKEPGGDINITKSYKGMAFEASSPDLKVRNCIIVNPLGDGIYVAWQGKGNEVTNTFVVNAFYNGIATRSAQPGSVVRIKNCSIVFGWFYPSKGGAMSVFVGRQGKTILEGNVFAFNQTEGSEAGYGVGNTFGNDETVLKDNLFFQCQGGYYKYMDANKQSLLVWKPEELKALNKDPEAYVLAGASGNSDEDPKMSPDKGFFEKFSNFVASTPGKLNMTMMNEWRRSVGLPLQAEPGSARKNYGMAYPLAAVVPGLVSRVPGRGVQVTGPFESYRSETGGAVAGEAPSALAKDYSPVAFADLKKGAGGVKSLAGKAVTLKVSLGSKDTAYLLKDAPRDSYDVYKLLAPGASEPTRDYAYGYFLRGSAPAKEWERLLKKKDQYKDGVVVKGTAWYLGTDTYSYPVGIVVDDVAKD